ncbi:MAG: hypothetical protein GY797_01580 [Deltaproteobacteria bacterium]|nr:hypothetical protein [Deltaproteobacteria bacterium]
MMIQWDRVYKLEADEFSEDPNKYAEPDLIYALSDLRLFTQRKMRPSPVKGALARFGGSTTSQHYVGESKEEHSRLSTGSDVFCEGPIFSIYSYLLYGKLFRGIGVYLDTTGPDGLPWVMLHLDIRPFGFNNNLPLIWIAEKVYDPKKEKKVTKYRYPQSDSKYWKLFNDERLYRDKLFAY